MHFHRSSQGLKDGNGMRRSSCGIEKPARLRKPCPCELVFLPGGKGFREIGAFASGTGVIRGADSLDRFVLGVLSGKGGSVE